MLYVLPDGGSEPREFSVFCLFLSSPSQLREIRYKHEFNLFLIQFVCSAFKGMPRLNGWYRVFFLYLRWYSFSGGFLFERRLVRPLFSTICYRNASSGNIIYKIFCDQVEDDGSVDYDMVISIIPDQYQERAKNMIYSCNHLGKYLLTCW